MALSLACTAHAQNAPTTVVAACPSDTVYNVGNGRPLIMNQNGLLCVSATGAATIGAVTQSTGNVATPWAIGGTVADDAAAGGNPVPIGGIYNTTLPTYTALDRAQAQFTATGSLRATLNPIAATGNDTFANTQLGTFPAPNSQATQLIPQEANMVFGATQWARQRDILGSFGAGTGVTAVEKAGSPHVEMSTNTTLNAIKTGAGVLHKACINTKGASSNTLKFYDALTVTGTPIASIDTTTDVECLEYDMSFTTGLTAIMATGTAADVTIIYR